MREKKIVIILFLFWLGMAAVPVEVPAKIIRVAEIKALLIQHVESHMPWAVGTLRLGFSATLADLSFPGEEVKCAVHSRAGEDYLGETSFLVKFYAGDLLLKEENVRVSLEVQRDVVVATRDLVKNREITSSDVAMEKKWMKRVPVNAIHTTAEAIGKAPSLNLRADAEITRNILKEPLLVKRGSMVHILLDEGRLNITTLGVSEEDGVAAAVIKVKNVSSNKILYARVVGDAVVKVEF